jgi:hypothetical protein
LPIFFGAPACLIFRVIKFPPGDNAKSFEKMLPEHHSDRNVARVALATDKDAPNATAVMPRNEGMPVSAKSSSLDDAVK